MEQRKVQILQDKLCQHKVLCINYTAYNMWHDQDSLNAQTHGDFMVLSGGNAKDGEHHSYKYGCVLGFYHAMVQYTDTNMVPYGPLKVDFIWV